MPMNSNESATEVNDDNENVDIGSLPVARSGKDYATIVSEVLLAAGVEPRKFLTMFEKAEKKVGLRITKTMKKELKKKSSGNRIGELSDQGLQIVLSYLNLRDLLVNSLVDKNTKNRTLVIVKNDAFTSFDINYNLIQPSEVLFHARSLVWLKPKLKSLKLYVGGGDKFLIRILLNVLGNKLENLEIKQYKNVSFTKSWLPESIRRHLLNLVGTIDLTNDQNKEWAHIQNTIISYVKSLFRFGLGTAFNYNYSMEDFFVDSDGLLDNAYCIPRRSCTEIRQFCPNLQTFRTNASFVVNNLPRSLKNLHLDDLVPSPDLSSLPNLFCLSFRGSNWGERITITSPTLQVLDLRKGTKQIGFSLAGLPNLNEIHIATGSHGSFVYGPFPHLVIDDHVVCGYKQFSRDALERFPQNTPLLPEQFRFSNTRRGYPDDLPKKLTIVVYGNIVIPSAVKGKDPCPEF
eukprot:g1192.t1